MVEGVQQGPVLVRTFLTPNVTTADTSTLEGRKEKPETERALS